MSTLSDSKLRTLKDKHLEAEAKAQVKEAKESVKKVELKTKTETL